MKKRKIKKIKKIKELEEKVDRIEQRLQSLEQWYHQYPSTVTPQYWSTTPSGEPVYRHPTVSWRDSSDA